MAQDGPKMRHTGPQDGPKMRDTGPQDGPKMRDTGPQMAQDGAKMGQDAAQWVPSWTKIAPSCAKMDQDGQHTVLCDGGGGGKSRRAGEGMLVTWEPKNVTWEHKDL